MGPASIGVSYLMVKHEVVSHLNELFHLQQILLLSLRNIFLVDKVFLDYLEMLVIVELIAEI